MQEDLPLWRWLASRLEMEEPPVADRARDEALVELFEEVSGVRARGVEEVCASLSVPCSRRNALVTLALRYELVASGTVEATRACLARLATVCAVPATGRLARPARLLADPAFLASLLGRPRDSGLAHAELFAEVAARWALPPLVTAEEARLGVSAVAALLYLAPVEGPAAGQAAGGHPLADRALLARKHSGAVAVIGIGAWYPGSQGAAELWENVLARRRQFRRFLDQRMPAADYLGPGDDQTYGTRGAFIDGFDFDTKLWRINRQKFEATDPVHWLSMEVSLMALRDAGLVPADGPPRAANGRITDAGRETGVIVGNSLTGEGSRAINLRLRWPYVAKAVRLAARDHGIPPAHLGPLMRTLEERFKDRLAPTSEDTLAGALSNTIAGHITKFFGFQGGGYTVDGACASSLLAIAQGVDDLRSGRMGTVLAGGVDMSLDPLEMVGFSRAGALTKSDMRVYGRDAVGFLPGEGCGFVVLRRLEDAVADGQRVLAVVEGAGIASDGQDGIMAPVASGQALGLARAYEQAPFAMRDVHMVEGHGTGTPAGDRAELTAIATVVGEGAPERSVAVTSLKSIIGHTKAASGVGAFIKAVVAVNQRVIPPTAGITPGRGVAPLFDELRALYPSVYGEVLDPATQMRAGVSGMGFGGIDAHKVLRSPDGPPDPSLAPAEDPDVLMASPQDAELFVLAAASPRALLAVLRAAADEARDLSVAELTDYSFHLLAAAEGQAALPARFAAVAATPEELVARLRAAAAELDARPLRRGASARPHPEALLAFDTEAPRVGFLFPGQGSQCPGMARTLLRRHAWARDTLARLSAAAAAASAEAGCAAPPDVEHLLLHARMTGVEGRGEPAYVRLSDGLRATEAAQPALCAAAAVWLEFLGRVGLRPAAVAGHSLGELAALHAAGVLSADELARVAAARGAAMMVAGAEDAGTMLAVSADEGQTAALVEAVLAELGDGETLCVSNYNAPRRHVVSGTRAAVARAREAAAKRGLESTVLHVSGAFHSPLVRDAAERFRAACGPVLGGAARAARVPVFSSRTGAPLEAPALGALADHLAGGITDPVRYTRLVAALREADVCDVLLEVGPRSVLTSLTSEIVGGDAGGGDGARKLCYAAEPRPGRFRDLTLLLAEVAVARGAGGLALAALREGRFFRAYVPVASRTFFTNPCELLPDDPEFRALVEAAMNGVGDAAADAARRKFSFQGVAARKKTAGGASHAAGLSAHGTRSGRVGSIAVRRSTAGAAQQDDAAGDGGGGGGGSAAATPESVLSAVLTCATNISGLDASPGSTMDDMNLDSIKRSRLIADAGKAAGLQAARVNPTHSSWRDAPSLAAVAERLFELVEKHGGGGGGGGGEGSRGPRKKRRRRKRRGGRRASAAAANESEAEAEDEEAGAESAAATWATSTLPPWVEHFVEEWEPEEEDGVAALAAGGAEAPATRVAVVHYEFASTARPSPLVGELAAAVHREMRVPNDHVVRVPLRFEADVDAAAERLAAEGFTHVVVAVPRAAEARAASPAAAADSGLELSLGVEGDGAPASEADFEAWRARHAMSFLPQVARLLRSAVERPPAGLEDPVRCLLVAADGADSAFCVEPYAATTHLELEGAADVCVLLAPLAAGDAAAAQWAAAELRRGSADRPLPGFAVVRQRGRGVPLEHRVARRLARVRSEAEAARLAAPGEDGRPPALVVSGGGRGITAQCALAYAAEFGCPRLVLLGRAAASHPEVAATLAECAARGVRARYFACDVTSARSCREVAAAVASGAAPGASGGGDASGEPWSAAALLHGAAINRACPVFDVQPDTAVSEMAPKVRGLENLLAAFHDGRADGGLRAVACLSSVIACTGLFNSGVYGYANRSMELVAARRASERTRVVSVRYSLWGEVGMAARMGSVDFVSAMGMEALDVESGTGALLELLASRRPPGAPAAENVVVTSRVGDLATWPRSRRPSGGGRPDPRRALVRRVLCQNPGVDAVLFADVTRASHPYLPGHVINGSLVVPAVMQLEAAAGGAEHVCGAAPQEYRGVTFSDVEFLYAIDVPHAGRERVQVLLSRHPDAEPGSLAFEVRSSGTGFTTPACTGVVRLASERGRGGGEGGADGGEDEDDEADRRAAAGVEAEYVAAIRAAVAARGKRGSNHLDPELDLYGDAGLLFHRGEFKRLTRIETAKWDDEAGRGYVISTVRRDDAGAEGRTRAGHAPVTGDPFARDAVLQSGLAALPTYSLLPASVRSLRVYPVAVDRGEQHVMMRIRRLDRQTYEADVVACAAGSYEVTERWERLVYSQLAPPDFTHPTCADLMQPSGRDQRLVAEALQRAARDVMSVTCPTVVVRSGRPWHRTPEVLRRGEQAAMAAKALAGCRLFASGSEAEGVKLVRRPSGAPELRREAGAPGPAPPRVSVSHTDRVMVLAVQDDPDTPDGEPFGIDLVHVGGSGRDGVERLLPGHEETTARLLADGDAAEVAAARVWGAVEAAHKADNSHEMSSLLARPLRRYEGAVLLWVAPRGGGQGAAAEEIDSSKAVVVLTLPLRLTVGPRMVLAVTVSMLPPVASPDADSWKSGHHLRCTQRKIEGGSPIMVLLASQSLAFREARSATRHVLYTHYVGMVGHLRELGIQLDRPLYTEWTRLYTGGALGSVTDWLQLRVHGPASPHDVLEIELSMPGYTSVSAGFVFSVYAVAMSGKDERPGAGTGADGKRLRHPPPPVDIGDGWTVYYNPDDSVPFYCHSKSGKSQWERPAHLPSPGTAEVMARRAAAETNEAERERLISSRRLTERRDAVPDVDVVHGPRRERRLVASGAMQLSSVRMDDVYGAALTEWPVPIYKYYHSMGPLSPTCCAADLLPSVRRPEPAEHGAAQRGPAVFAGAGLPRVHMEAFQTSNFNSNVVGNVYFANYFEWGSIALEAFLRRVDKALVAGEHGAEFATVAVDTDFSVEAFPNDRVGVEVFLDEVQMRGMTVRYVYHRLDADDEPTEQLCVARGAVLYAEVGDDAYDPLPLPEQLMAFLEGFGFAGQE